MKRAIALLIIISAAVAPAFAQTAEDIIRRMEANEVHQTAHAVGSMVIHDRFGDRTTRFESWAEGEDKALIEFTSAAEAGQKILRTDDQIYLYYPDAAELIRLKGSALRDSVMGSDMSYEDMTGGKGLLSDYEVTLAGMEDVDGISCYRIDMEAKSRDVPYASQTLWIDAQRYFTRQAHMYARSGIC